MKFIRKVVTAANNTEVRYLHKDLDNLRSSLKEFGLKAQQYLVDPTTLAKIDKELSRLQFVLKLKERELG